MYVSEQLRSSFDFILLLFSMKVARVNAYSSWVKSPVLGP